MKFCNKCGSRMKKTKNGFLCRKRGSLIPANTRLPKNVKKIEPPSSVYIVSDSKDEYVKTSRVCPKCGNKEAFRWFSSVSGEHAGVRRERTIEHFKCTRCSYSWTKT